MKNRKVLRHFILMLLLQSIFLIGFAILSRIFSLETDKTRFHLSIKTEESSIREGETSNFQLRLKVSGRHPDKVYLKNKRLEIQLPVGTVFNDGEMEQLTKSIISKPRSELGIPLGTGQTIFPIFDKDSSKLVYEFPIVKIGETYNLDLPIRMLAGRRETNTSFVVSARLIQNKSILVTSRSAQIKVHPYKQRVGKLKRLLSFVGPRLFTVRMKLVNAKDNTIPLSGVRVELFTDTWLEPQTTSEEGVVEFRNLYPDTFYSFHQKNPSQGYLWDSSRYRLEFSPSGGQLTVGLYHVRSNTQNNVIESDFDTRTHTINLTLQVHPFRILKVDKRDPNIKLAGAIFELYDENQQKVDNVEATSNSDGIAVFPATDHLFSRDSSYYIKEKSAPDSYRLDDTFYRLNVSKTGSVSVEDTSGVVTAINGLDASLQVVNERENVTSRIKIVKKDSATGQPIQFGSIFQLVDANGLDIPGQEALLTSNGSFTYENFVLQPGQTYGFREVTAPTGYSINSKIYKFQVDEDGRFQFENADNYIQVDYGNIVNGTRLGTVSVKNDRIPYTHITFRKVNDSGSTLRNAEFQLTDSQGIPLPGQMGTMSSSGNIEFSTDLEIGETYGFKEIAAPPGYVKREKTYLFTVRNDGGIEITNEDDFVSIDNLGNRDPVTQLSVVEISFKNIKPSEFPQTGGWGSLFFIFIGGVIITFTFAEEVILKRFLSKKGKWRNKQSE